MLDAWGLGKSRPASGRNQNIGRGVLLAVHLYGVIVNQACRAFNDFRARAFKQIAINTVQPVNFFVFILNQLFPINRPLADRPPKAGGIFKMIPKL